MSIGSFSAAPRKSLVGYVEEELRNALIEGAANIIDLGIDDPNLIINAH